MGLPGVPQSLPSLQPPWAGDGAAGLSPCVVPQPPQMSRLGLLAVAFSDGKVLLYSLPHPGALRRSKATQVKGRKSRAAGRGPPAIVPPRRAGRRVSPGAPLPTPGGPAVPGVHGAGAGGPSPGQHRLRRAPAGPALGTCCWQGGRGGERGWFLVSEGAKAVLAQRLGRGDAAAARLGRGSLPGAGPSTGRTGRALRAALG